MSNACWARSLGLEVFPGRTRTSDGNPVIFFSCPGGESCAAFVEVFLSFGTTCQRFEGLPLEVMASLKRAGRMTSCELNRAIHRARASYRERLRASRTRASRR